MWGLFVAAVLFGAVALHLPGFLALRAFRLSGLSSVVCAPLLTLPAYSILAIVYAELGIWTSWSILTLPVLALGMILYIISSCRKQNNEGHRGFASVVQQDDTRKHFRFDWLCLGFYVVVGTAVSSVFLLGALGNPDSYVQHFDNVHHLGVTRSFVESGNWSSFSATLYATSADAAINPLPGIGFYPSAWNDVAALMVSALNVPVALAANAVNFLFTALVLPSGMFVLLRLIFCNRRSIVPFGALCTLAFTAFPWGLLTFGPLYPNLIAFALVPVVCRCFMSMLARGVERRSRLFSGILFCCGLVAFVFTQPNAVFTTAVFLAPFCVYQAVRAVDILPFQDRKKLLIQIGFGALCVLLIAGIWFALFKAPFLQSVVNHVWPPVAGKAESVVDALLLSFREPPAQIALAVLVMLGVLYTLLKREFLWLSVSYAFACFIYVVSASAAADSVFRFLFSGFWYTDSFRTAAFVALFAVPLAAVGLWVVARAGALLLGKIAPSLKPRAVSAVSSLVVVSVFLCANFYVGYPSFQEPEKNTAFGWLQLRLKAMHGVGEGVLVLSAEEQAFAEEAEKLIPEGSVVINEPNDGSVFLYSTDGLDIYYRYLRTYGGDDETLYSKLIRNNLDDIASDDRVKKAVDQVGAQYVLVLDQGEAKNEQEYLFTYENGEDWKGIDSVSDNTPGFEVMLSRGDMRLYKITAAL